MPLVTESIKFILRRLARSDLYSLYNVNMEVQVNVAQDNGERISGEYKGKFWQGYTDGITTWKSFRIPWNAATEPRYEDKEIKFNLGEHVEGIGLTGWDWKERVSKWVAFDFDSLIGHKTGLTNEELNLIQKHAEEVDYITIRKSTGGNGLHYYVFLKYPEPTNNHTEHQALGRAILGQLSAETGFNFNTKVDICGSNMWIWHRKMHKQYGLTLLKSGGFLETIPKNWKDHITVVLGRRKKNLPQNIEEKDKDSFEELTGQYVKEPLDKEHKRLINYFKENDCVWWWDQDNHMLVTHTYHLKDAYKELNLRGLFSTNSSGTTKHNCFMYPLRLGGWVVRRFSPGVRESESWDQDSSGYTRCYYNVDPNLSIASRSFEGVEHPSGGYVFRQAEEAQKASIKLGADLALPAWALNRPTKLKTHKDGRLIAEIDKENSDQPIKGWLAEGKKWKRIFNINSSHLTESENLNYDDVLRHLCTEDKDAGWVVKSNNQWIDEPLTHVKAALRSLGLQDREVTSVVGDNIFRRWTLVNKPFQPEYPGDREWNRDSCQLNYYPSKEEYLNYPTWLNILNHVGANLTTALSSFPWARDNGIKTGADYLKCWIASLFQEPTEPLPYLFLFGPEASGKSIFHEALSLLITSKGYSRAEVALQSAQAFNGELVNAILCAIEEVDLSGRTKTPYLRIKDWVTATHIPIHPKNGTPYLAVNTTHWIQCSNEITFCPVFPGDTRITLIHVETLRASKPKRDIFIDLRKEAPDFLGELMRLELPKSCDRLNVPVISTSEKYMLEKQNENSLEQFISERCFLVAGSIVKLSDFYSAFMEFLDSTEAATWTTRTIVKNLKLPVVKGRGENNQVYLGNISLEPKEPGKMLTVINDKLVPKL